MKTVGIIAEFNPFHKGHEYLIRTLKKETGSDYAVIVMSGDYTQRGAPAILDKYTRTKMALLGGADLVLELPIYYSTSSAEFFAGGAISILNNIGVTNCLGFGSESGDISAIKKVAGVLADEPEGFPGLLKDNLRSGMNYAAARAAALNKYLSKESESDTVITSLISNPNDILATEYVKALILQKSTVTPYAIKRVGASYDAETLSSDSAGFSSAKAIRAALEGNAPDTDAGVNNQDLLSREDSLRALSNMPEEVCAYIKALHSEGELKLTTLDDFSELLHYKLILEKNAGYTRYLDVNSDLSDKIAGAINGFTTFSDFVMKLKSKNLTYTRINRALLHILLGMASDKLDVYSADRSAFTSYARILGFNKNASPLLKKIQECSRIPVISTLSDAYKALDEKAYMLLSDTVSASNIYDLVRGCSPINEYSKAPIILVSDMHKD
ncbi:tRNA(Met) cytidine acetate ligase [Butyrivibrio sp. XPD2002]|uniref:tRNA(Met) cytidine acetate ligase n=1 Tax=Butyrivibrio sp. XPD2002 TaxID=1280665 RepID=UPI00040C5C8A|nr:nucleotidyltransferase family protein [Butyrivibrio sp. XPD2002]